MNPEDIDNSGLENLCIGIIEQAVSDYRTAWKTRAGITQEDLDKAEFIIETHDDGKHKREVTKAKNLLDKEKDAIITADSCRKFFSSEWYSKLTSVDGDYIIRKLDEELEAEYEFIKGDRAWEGAA